MACMTSLVNIAKQRLQYVSFAVDVVAMLSGNSDSKWASSYPYDLSSDGAVMFISISV